MSIFEKFQNTVFVKDSSELERKIKALTEIKDKVKEKEQIEKEIKLAELGLAGENRIKYELKCANIGMYVLHDVNVIGDDLSAQIDWVIITSAHCYLVECKNLIGNVTVNSEGEFRRYYQYKGNQVSEAIYSPYRQAVRHKDILKKNWRSRHSKISALLYENNFEDWYKPLVVFSNSNGILNIKYAPKEIKQSIVKVDGLIDYLKKDIAKKSKDELNTKKEMEDIAKKILLEINTMTNKNYIEKYTILEKEETKANVFTNVENNKNNDDDALRKRLINFRKEKSQNGSKKFPAYYIFTNEELEKLVSLKPKTIEELRNLKILSEVKIKCHGEEIIAIILKI